MVVDLTSLKLGDRVKLVGGLEAEIVEPSEDGRWILVRYLKSPRGSALVDTQDLCAAEEVEALIES
jgi:hypothetical protein